MHAYLITGYSGNHFETEISDLAQKIKAKVLSFPIAKIEDVRSLNSLVRLSFEAPTLIVSENIHDATPQALNAFLKNLEEPQENIYFALTCPSTKKVLPTIVSRCQIIRVNPEKHETANKEELESFLKMSVGQRLAFFDKIKDRGTAIGFIESLIFWLHEKKDFKNIEEVIKTLTGLKANGTVNLHLANLAIKYGHKR